MYIYLCGTYTCICPYIIVILFFSSTHVPSTFLIRRKTFVDDIEIVSIPLPCG